VVDSQPQIGKASYEEAVVVWSTGLLALEIIAVNSVGYQGIEKAIYVA
jgi:hypothetical protein